LILCPLTVPEGDIARRVAKDDRKERGTLKCKTYLRSKDASKFPVIVHTLPTTTGDFNDRPSFSPATTLRMIRERKFFNVAMKDGVRREGRGRSEEVGKNGERRVCQAARMA
jgi:hypothetical protein